MRPRHNIINLRGRPSAFNQAYLTLSRHSPAAPSLPAPSTLSLFSLFRLHQFQQNQTPTIKATGTSTSTRIMAIAEPRQPPTVGRDNGCVGDEAVRAVVTVAVSMEGVESNDPKLGLAAVVVSVVREVIGVGAVAVPVEVRVSTVGESAGSLLVVMSI